MIRNVGLMKAQLNQIQETLDVLINVRTGSGYHGPPESAVGIPAEDLFEIPLSSMDKFEELESRVKDKQTQIALVSAFSCFCFLNLILWFENSNFLVMCR